MPRSVKISRQLLALSLVLTFSSSILACGDDSHNDPDIGDPDGETPNPPSPDDEDPGANVESKVKIYEEDRATVIWNGPLAANDKRPVIVSMPGWEGNQDRKNEITALDRRLRDEGYIVLTIGFDYVAFFQSTLLTTVKTHLDTLCADAEVPADCGSVLLLGNSYSGMQNNYVFNHLELNGYDGSSSKKVLGFVSVNAGYAPPGQVTDEFGNFTREGLADANRIGVAVIQNRDDEVFSINACTWGNCGVRVLSTAHRAENHANFFSICPDGGTHSTTRYADWDEWIVTAVKQIIHGSFEKPTFDGYTEPWMVLTNDCN